MTLLVRLLLWALRVSPPPLAHWLSRRAVGVFTLAIPKLRATGRRNLELAGLPTGILDGVSRHVARNLFWFARLPQLNAQNIREVIDYEGFEHYAEAKRRGRGVLFATAHLGNWELSAIAHSLLTEPMHVVVRPLDHPGLDAIVEAQRARTGNTVIAKKNAAREILRALRRNQPVGILVDQNSLPPEGGFIRFFGLDAATNLMFVRLAHQSGAAIIPGFALWRESQQRHVLKFYPPLPLTGDVVADTQKLHAVIEGVIREYPDQWMWWHRRWKTRPPGEPDLY